MYDSLEEVCTHRAGINLNVVEVHSPGGLTVVIALLSLTAGEKIVKNLLTAGRQFRKTLITACSLLATALNSEVRCAFGNVSYVDTSNRSVFCEIEPIEHLPEIENNNHLIPLRDGLLYSGPHKIRLFLNTIEFKRKK